MEAKYRRMQQRPSELRGRDRERAWLLEDKKRLLGEVLEEVWLEAPPHTVYIHPVQEEVKEQEPRSREGRQSISKVGEGLLNIPLPARQQDQAKVVFSLRDLIEGKKKAEEEKVENLAEQAVRIVRSKYLDLLQKAGNQPKEVV